MTNDKVFLLNNTQYVEGSGQRFAYDSTKKANLRLRAMRTATAYLRAFYVGLDHVISFDITHLKGTKAIALTAIFLVTYKIKRTDKTERMCYAIWTLVEIP